MNILVVAQFYKPETFIINDLVLEMEKLGHSVTVLTGKPNYPEGDIFPGFRQSGIQKEVHGNNIEVFRVPLIPRRQGRAINLLQNYLSFMLSATFLGPWVLRGKPFDMIFVFAVSPITQAVPAIVLKFLKRAKLCVWVLDLWPQSLVVTGYFKNQLLLSIVEIFVKGIYSLTDLVLVPSKAFFNPILKIYKKSKLAYYPNSFKKIDPVLLTKTLPNELDRLLNENFCVVFAGNLGLAQSVETVVGAAQLLKDIPQLKIIFVGSGAKLNWIEQEKKRLSLENIECVGRFDLSFMPAIYAKAKVMLLTLKSDEILQYTLPWKIQSYLAMAKPVIGAIDGEGARVIIEAQCGFVGPAEDSKALADNIKAAMALPPIRLSEFGKNGLHYFEKHFEMESQVSRLIEIFKKLIGDK